MTTQQLIDLYRTWDDEKLIAAVQKRQDYTEIALTAMLTVIDERKISGGSEAVLKEVKEQEKQDAVQKQNMYEFKMLHEIISSADYAKKNKDSRGEYYSNDIVSNNFKVLRMFLFIFSLVGFVCAVIAIFADAPLDYSYLYFGIPAVIFLFIGLKLFKKSKAHFKLFEQGRKNIFHLQHDKYEFQATVPFKYFVFWTKIEIRKGAIKITHPMLSLVITNQSNDSILLQGNLPALQKAPPDWAENNNSCTPHGTKFFSESAFNPVDIIRLKKIIDGLHDMNIGALK